MPLAPGRRLGPYEIVSPLGAGGMGEVYEARDTRLGRRVAVKVLPEELASEPDRRARFEREAIAVAALNHPNIVTIYGVEESEAGVYLAMEYVEGATLNRAIPPHGMEVERIFELAVPLVDAVATAHARGVVHRDLKPANVMITAEGRVKVLDFGLAKLREIPAQDGGTRTMTQPLTREGEMLGTVPYMAPEQVRGEDPDERTDVFALGSVLFEMGTGRRPFAGEASVEVLHAILSHRPPALDAVRPELPRHLGRIVTRCLEKEPRRRFQSAADLRNDLEDLARELGLGGAPSRHRAREPAASASAGSIDSLAVLPLASLSSEPDQDYFADGMTDALITELAKIPGLRVISRTSAMQYKKSDRPVPEIVRELGVDAVVEGSVLRVGSEVRITAQLVHGASDSHLWADDYLRPIESVLRLQREIARQIGDNVRKRAGAQGEKPPSEAAAVDGAAYDAILRARHHTWRLTKDDFARAARWYQRALEGDPTSARAHAGVAVLHLLRGFYSNVPPREVMPALEAKARAALELDETVAEAHLALAGLRLFFHCRPDEAVRHGTRAAQIDPSFSEAHNLLGWAHATRGDLAEALNHHRRGLSVDPLSPFVNSHYALTLSLAGEPEAALEHFEHTVDLAPRFWMAHQAHAAVLTSVGRHGEAVAAAERGADLSGADESALAVLGVALARAGRRAEAEEVQERLVALREERYVRANWIAIVPAALGKLDVAFDWMDRAVAEHAAASGTNFRVHPAFAPLRDHPRAAELEAKLGLEPLGPPR